MTDREFIPIANPNIDSKEAQAVYDVIKSGWISMGKKVQELEAKICKYIGVKHAILFNSGTSSLHTALIAAGVKILSEIVRIETEYHCFLESTKMPHP